MDAVYNDLNTDIDPANDVDIWLEQPRPLRADISCAVYPCVMTYGMMYSVLPFGNQTVVGEDHRRPDPGDCLTPERLAHKRRVPGCRDALQLLQLQESRSLGKAPRQNAPMPGELSTPV